LLAAGVVGPFGWDAADDDGVDVAVGGGVFGDQTAHGVSVEDDGGEPWGLACRQRVAHLQLHDLVEHVADCVSSVSRIG
jgi:hypothetical protein